ncbi:hypothetical protein ACFVW8_06905 [Streptomyces sp. NPDC058221]|uniref:hypothetical protein n=1 Tax=Streptomyces sp. NPDC058221 TaxID=3346388 RepID=UPI0036E1DA11
MAADAPDTRREYRFMGSTHKLWLSLSAPALGAVALVYDMAGSPVIVPIAVGAGFTALFVFVGVAIARVPVTATLCDEHRLTVRKAFGTHTMAWQDVQGIEIHNVAGHEVVPGEAPRRLVVLYHATGSRHVLPHLDDRKCQDLAHEVALLRQMWLAYRGQDWSPVPDVQDRIARSRRRSRDMSLFTLSLLSLMITLFAGAGIFWAASEMGMYPADGIGAPDSFVEMLLHPMTLLVLLPVVTTVGLLAATVIRRR